jgi:hypothetical protein
MNGCMDAVYRHAVDRIPYAHDHEGIYDVYVISEQSHLHQKSIRWRSRLCRLVE